MGDLQRLAVVPIPLSQEHQLASQLAKLFHHQFSRFSFGFTSRTTFRPAVNEGLELAQSSAAIHSRSARGALRTAAVPSNIAFRFHRAGGVRGRFTEPNVVIERPDFPGIVL